MVCQTNSNYMEQLPPWAVGVLLSLVGSAIGIISYFLKRRDTTIDDMATERKQVDVVLNSKVDTILDSVNNITTEMATIKTQIENIKETVHKDFTRIEVALKDTTSKVSENSNQISDMRTTIASLSEWKKQIEK